MLTNEFMMCFFFASVADDTCLSLQEYLQDPKNTTLDDLLPCAALASTGTQYLQVRKDMKDLIKSVWIESLRIYHIVVIIGSNFKIMMFFFTILQPHIEQVVLLGLNVDFYIKISYGMGLYGQENR